MAGLSNVHCSVYVHRPHHIGGPTTNIKNVIELKCMETTTTKKVISFY